MFGNGGKEQIDLPATKQEKVPNGKIVAPSGALFFCKALIINTIHSNKVPDTTAQKMSVGNL